MEGNTYSVQLTEIKRELTLAVQWCVCVCEHMCVSLVDTCGAIMTGLGHLCLRITLGYRSALVRHVAG